MIIYQSILIWGEVPEPKYDVDPGKGPWTNGIIAFAKAQTRIQVGQVNRWILASTLKG